MSSFDALETHAFDGPSVTVGRTRQGFALVTQAVGGLEWVVPFDRVFDHGHQVVLATGDTTTLEAEGSLAEYGAVGAALDSIAMGELHP